MGGQTVPTGRDRVALKPQGRPPAGEAGEKVRFRLTGQSWAYGPITLKRPDSEPFLIKVSRVEVR